ncbi:MAG: hypothetical protein JWO38_2146, partial [Gemmataceae bacterium]|nr:hypothetical protein [Gemmataceae bacterium]
WAAALVLVVKMGIAGVAGGVAAGLGWMWGKKGDNKPWAGFAAAFGAGVMMAVILLSFSSSLVRLVLVAGSVFGATFTTAARGGHRS